MGTRHGWRSTFSKHMREPEHSGWHPQDLERMNVELRADQRKHDVQKLVTLTDEQVEGIVTRVLVRYPSIYRKPVEATVSEVMAVLRASIIDA